MLIIQDYYLGFSSSSDPAEGTQWRLCEAKRHLSKGKVTDRGLKNFLVEVTEITHKSLCALSPRMGEKRDTY